MEDSASTSMNKLLFSHEEYLSSATSTEESGWTIYFEDFFASSEKRKDDQDGADCTTISEGGSSLVSDAASHCFNSFESRKKLSFRKSKSRRVLYDDPLEDTASSPLSGPKVNEMDILKVNQRKKDDHSHIFQVKDEGIEKFAGGKKNEMDELGHVDGADQCTELKKRGLCLVPLSMLVDHLG